MNKNNIIWWRVWLAILLTLMVFVIVNGLVSEIVITSKPPLERCDYFKIAGFLLASLAFYWWNRRK